MVDIIQWHERIVCPDCGWHKEANAHKIGLEYKKYKLLGGNKNLCEQCGRKIIDDCYTEGGTFASKKLVIVSSWTTKIMRYVDTSTWHKPWTWGQGYWQTREQFDQEVKEKNRKLA